MIQNIEHSAEPDKETHPARLQSVLRGALRMHNVSVSECRKLLAIINFAEGATLGALEEAITDYVAEESR